MRRTCCVYRRVLRRHWANTTVTEGPSQLSSMQSAVSLSGGMYGEASSLAMQLLRRHRQQQHERAHDSTHSYNHEPAVSPLSGYGKTAVIQRLARLTNVEDVGTEALLRATDDEWESRIALERAPTRLGALRRLQSSASGKSVSRRRSRATRSLAGKEEDIGDDRSLVGFDSVPRRYDAVVPSGNVPDAVSAAAASKSWKMNLVSNLTRSGTLRGVTAWNERCERQHEWQRVREFMFSGRGDSTRVDLRCQPEHSRRDNSESAVLCPSTKGFYTSLAFHRYCRSFGSGKISSEAFMIDPALYYVLGNLNTTADESLEEVHKKAEELHHRYNNECHMRTDTVKENTGLCRV
ncbi:hypothetical protein, conserved [Trypanosoma brucei gambiense DAL972]|uniref:Uncharacterized protein n=1 Tax=Trypanosoma brucei gambiense (strain MHOM/CI/86/DAL972) TaxID=679716 RepID=D0A9F3_TRYB9|nr:hypothetical protein, conserved [Trypanosoma brucei gambiense DAL972]CBH18304.1 hypothetical protein, conserved [Trypanosoma brucei gambiense DAL972]|eukprot:XP_011780568.1 hypothetical protein, conserved [Trypanosoma brucei gambiense DAL972]